MNNRSLRKEERSETSAGCGGDMRVGVGVWTRKKNNKKTAKTKTNIRTKSLEPKVLECVSVSKPRSDPELLDAGGDDGSGWNAPENVMRGRYILVHGRSNTRPRLMGGEDEQI